MLRIGTPSGGRPADCMALGAEKGRAAAPGCTACVAVAVVDNRPVALLFPASRRVVLERLAKLFRADEVRLAACDEVDRILPDPADGSGLATPAPATVPLLMDASLLSAPAIEVRPCGDRGPVRLTLEDWLATARPTLGFFTEPARGLDA